MQKTKQQGLSLVEIMVAMVLGLVITAAVFQTYLSARRTQQTQEGLATRQESLRFATMLITRDLRMSGYRGCLRDGGRVVNLLKDDDKFLFRFNRHIEGFDANGDDWEPKIENGIEEDEIVVGTDVLAVRTVFGTEVLTTVAMPNRLAPLTVASNILAPLLKSTGGDIVLVTDCGGATIFQVTSFLNATGIINHIVGGLGIEPGNRVAQLNRIYDRGAQVMPIATISYFVRESETGSGPALWRQIGDADPVEMVEGIDNLQLRYGEDTSGDLTPDVYRRADQVVDWTRVTAIEVALLASSRDPVGDPDPRTFQLLDEVVGPFSDRKLRRATSFIVSLRNNLP